MSSPTRKGSGQSGSFFVEARMGGAGTIGPERKKTIVSFKLGSAARWGRESLMASEGGRGHWHRHTKSKWLSWLILTASRSAIARMVSSTQKVRGACGIPEILVDSAELLQNVVGWICWKAVMGKLGSTRVIRARNAIDPPANSISYITLTLQNTTSHLSPPCIQETLPMPPFSPSRFTTMHTP